MPTLFIVVSHLVEVILVELAHEAGEVAMFEMFGKDRLGEPFVLRRKSARAVYGWCPFARTSSTTKLPPSSPHRTTWEYDGSSSILIVSLARCSWRKGSLYEGKHTCRAFAPGTRVSRSPFPGWWIAEATYKIAGAVCASTANTLPVVHIIVEAHWIDLIGDLDTMGEGNGD